MLEGLAAKAQYRRGDQDPGYRGGGLPEAVMFTPDGKYILVETT